MLGFNRNIRECDVHYAVMPMMTSQILKSVDFTKTQKSRYLKNEILFFLQKKKKKIINYTLRATFTKNSFVAEVMFNKRRYLHIPGALRYQLFSLPQNFTMLQLHNTKNHKKRGL